MNSYCQRLRRRSKGGKKEVQARVFLILSYRTYLVPCGRFLALSDLLSDHHLASTALNSRLVALSNYHSITRPPKNSRRRDTPDDSQMPLDSDDEPEEAGEAEIESDEDHKDDVERLAR